MTTSPKKALALSTKLAKALGWAKMQVKGHTLYVAVQAPLGDDMFIPVWTVFDYRDWNVIAPIAEKYNCFPKKMINEWAVLRWDQSTYADTPQEAIAQAVVQYLTHQGKLK